MVCFSLQMIVTIVVGHDCMFFVSKNVFEEGTFLTKWFISVPVEIW